MPNVRFVEGTLENYDVVYDTDWPITPRVGELLSITVGTDQVIDWEVTLICHVADGNEKFTGTLAWIKQVSVRRS